MLRSVEIDDAAYSYGVIVLIQLPLAYFLTSYFYVFD